MPNDSVDAGVSCLAPRVLTAWSLGKLSGREFEQVSSHLDQCAGCQRQLDQLEPLEDSLLARLREAKGKPPIPPDPHRDAVLEAVKSTPKGAGSTAERGGSTDSFAPAPPPPHSSAPAQVPDLRLLRRLGHGGMGEVWLAEHLLLCRPVAVKFMLEHRSGGDAAERFKREMAAVGALDHPHVVRALNAGEADGVLYLVMEYLEGDSLKQIVVKRGPLPVGEACELVRQAALGLHYAHGKGIVHRDIKPSNLIFTPEGVKVLDLGLARWHQSEAAAEPLTNPGGILGTPGFMAPEQIHQPNAVGTRADIYALGATLYFLLTGKVPFPDPKTQVPEPLTLLCSDIPEEIIRMTETMMHRLPEKRFANAALTAEALKPWCSSRVAYDTIASAGRTPPRNADGVKRALQQNRRRWVAAAIILSALIGIVFFFAPLLRVETSHGTLVLEFPKGIPDGASVSVDGGKVTIKHLDAIRGEIVVTPGLREVIVTDGEKVFRREKVEITRGADTVLKVELAPPLPVEFGKAVPRAEKDAVGEIARIVGPAGGIGLYRPKGQTLGVAISPENAYAAASAGNQNVMLWDLRKREMMDRNILKSRGHGRIVTFSTDGTRYVTYYNNTVAFWDFATARIVRKFEHPNNLTISGIAVSPSGHFMAVGLSLGRVWIWDLRTNEKCQEIRYGNCKALDFTADGKFLISGDQTGSIRIWSIMDGVLEHKLEGHKYGVENLKVSKDGKNLTSVGHDGKGWVSEEQKGGELEIILWDLTTKKQIGAKSISYVSPQSGMSADGRRVLIGSPDGELTCYEVPSGKFLLREKRHKGAISGLAISADGSFAVSAGNDNVLRVWRLPASTE